MSKIIAIGGGEIGRPKEDGGFYPIETTFIDKEIIRLTGKTSPNLLFIPTATLDSPTYFELISSHFLSLGCAKVSVLNLIKEDISIQQTEDIILSADIIYVGGGNTLRMMNVWRKKGVDLILRKALEKNIVLSGISAGAICWFSFGNSDSRKFTSKSNQLIKVTGLGFISAFCCPHFDTEPMRQIDLKRMMKGSPYAAIALDDGAALEVIDNTFRIIISKPNAKAYKCFYKRGVYYKEQFPIEKSFRDVESLLKKDSNP